MKTSGLLSHQLCAAVAFLIFVARAVALSPESVPTVDEIVSRYTKAIGGAERIKQMNTLITRGEYREGGKVLTAGVLAKMRPNYKLVGDPAHPAGDFSEGYDGSAWEYYKDPGIVLRTVGKAAAAARHGLAIDGPLIDYRSKGSTITLRGREKIGGRKTYRLRVRMADGFEEDEFVDAETWLWVASRKVAAVHAFGREIATETRFSDYRPVDGILFYFLSSEVEIDTGEVLNEMKTISIVVNQKLDFGVFAPPIFTPTLLQKLLSDLFGERTDVQAVMWTYGDFRRAHPDIETDQGVQAIGYQMLKMGDYRASVALLSANALAYPQSSGAAFGLGRAWRETEEFGKAREQFKTALRLDPTNERARDALAAMRGEKARPAK